MLFTSPALDHVYESDIVSRAVVSKIPALHFAAAHVLWCRRADNYARKRWHTFAMALLAQDIASGEKAEMLAQQINYALPYDHTLSPYIFIT